MEAQKEGAWPNKDLKVEWPIVRASDAGQRLKPAMCERSHDGERASPQGSKPLQKKNYEDLLTAREPPRLSASSAGNNDEKRINLRRR